MGKRYLCDNCGYKWQSKKRFGEPSQCPSCKKGDIIQYRKSAKFINARRKRKKKIKQIKQEIRELKQKANKIYNPIIKKIGMKSKIFLSLTIVFLTISFYIRFFIYLFLITLILWLWGFISIKAYKSKRDEQTSDLQDKLDELKEEFYLKYEIGD